MKRAITSLIILILFIQPLYGLAPQKPDLTNIAVNIVAPILVSLREEADPGERTRLQQEVERSLSKVENVERAVVYWNTLTYNTDGSIEVVVNYVDKQGDNNLVLNRFRKVSGSEYYAEVIRDEPQINGRIASGALGLRLNKVLVPAGSLERAQGELPQALVNRRELIGDSPETDSLAYLYRVADEAPVQEVLGSIASARERMGKAINTVVVIGVGRVLGNRAVVQTLGSREVRFIFTDNVANPSRWLKELKGVNPENVLLYVSSKTGAADERMINLWFFLEWLIRESGKQLGWDRGDTDYVSSLLDNLGRMDLTQVKLNERMDLREEEKGLLNFALARIVVSTTPEANGPLYRFAVNNDIPIVPLQRSIEGRFSVLFPPGQFTTSLAGHDIGKMREAVLASAAVFVEDKPENNPALEAAMYAYASGMPILAGVSSSSKVEPIFEWLRQLVNEGLGKREKGPFLTSAVGNEASQDLMNAPRDKLFLVINIGEEKIDIPKGVSAIEINIPELNAEVLARIFLFLEEFVVRYANFLGVNPMDKPWIREVGSRFDRLAEGFDTSTGAREARQSEAGAVSELETTGGIPVPEKSVVLLRESTVVDEELRDTIQVPRDESGFHALLDIGRYRQPGEVEVAAQNLALQLYAAGRMGIRVNPFFIYSASPEANLLGKFAKYLGTKRLSRLKDHGGGILWDYLIGVTSQHETGQHLGEGSDIALTTFISFLQEPEEAPPVIKAGNGLIHERFNGKTPKEIATLNLQAMREALNSGGRITNTIEIPNEGEENLRKLYQLLVRTSELYSRLVKNEAGRGETLEGVVKGNTSTVIVPTERVKAGEYGKEEERDVVDLYSVAVPMQIGGVGRKGFINPMKAGAEVSSALNRFVSRISVLARTIIRIGSREGSALNRLFTAEEFRERARREIYAFRLEDAIAKVEVGTEVGDLWEEIRIKAANTMIAKTIQEIKRVNPEARVVVYSEEPGLNERRINAALDIVDCGGVFDSVVSGDFEQVLSRVVENRWVRDKREAREKTVFASRNRLEELKSVILPTEKFTPFPELAVVMQAILREADVEGKLPESVIEIIVSSYKVWLELAGFRSDEITPFLDEMRLSLSSGVNFSVSLPIPPAPKPGSVIKLLDDEYEEATKTKGYA